MTEDGGRSGRVALSIARVWLPLAIAVAGVVLVIAGHAKGGLAATGVVLLGIALIVWMLNWLFRLSIESNRDREQEEEARRFFKTSMAGGPMSERSERSSEPGGRAGRSERGAGGPAKSPVHDHGRGQRHAGLVLRRRVVSRRGRRDRPRPRARGSGRRDPGHRGRVDAARRGARGRRDRARPRDPGDRRPRAERGAGP